MAFDDGSLYNRQIPCRLLSPSKEFYVASLTLSLSFQALANQNQKALCFFLTDELDPYFVYSLELTEADFCILKREQCLHVDFVSFPQNLVDLFDRCSLDAQPRYSAEMAIGNKTGTLSIFELNHFKNLQHLSLSFREGNDTTIKKYLADKLAEFKHKANSRSLELAEARALIAARDTALTSAHREMVQAREAHLAALQDLRTSQEDALLAARESSLKDQQAEAARAEERRRAAEETQREAVRVVQTKLDEGYAALRAESEARLQAESHVANTKAHVSRLVSELEAAKGDCAELRDKMRQFDAFKFDSETASQKLGVLEKQLRDKDGLIDKMTALYDAATRQKTSVEESLGSARASLEKTETQLRESCKEISKGNSIIQHLQSEIQQLKSKVKLKSTVIQQQEALIQQRQHLLDDLHQQLDAATRELSSRENKISSLEQVLGDARRDLDESVQKLTSNEQVIAFLNKEITELRAAPSLPSAGSAASPFRPAANLTKYHYDPNANSSPVSYNHHAYPPHTMDASPPSAFLSRHASLPLASTSHVPAHISMSQLPTTSTTLSPAGTFGAYSGNNSYRGNNFGNSYNNSSSFGSGSFGSGGSDQGSSPSPYGGTTFAGSYSGGGGGGGLFASSHGRTSIGDPFAASLPSAYFGGAGSAGVGGARASDSFGGSVEQAHVDLISAGETALPDMPVLRA